MPLIRQVFGHNPKYQTSHNFDLIVVLKLRDYQSHRTHPAPNFMEMNSIIVKTWKVTQKAKNVNLLVVLEEKSSPSEKPMSIINGLPNIYNCIIMQLQR